MGLIRKFLNWFTGKNDKEQLKELKKTVPETPPPKLQIRTVQDIRAAIQIKTFQDIRAFCEEMRKDLRTYKKTINRMYVEWGNLSDQITRLLEGQKNEEHSSKQGNEIKESGQATGQNH